MTIKVSQSKFDEMQEMISVETIPNGYAKGFVTVKGIPYIITGSMGKGTGESGQKKFWGNKIVDLRLYNGDLEALSYDDYKLSVEKGERERGYNSIMTKCNGIDVVILPEQAAFEVEEPEKQLNLFK